MHFPSHPLSQHTPSAQCPLPHSLSQTQLNDVGFEAAATLSHETTMRSPATSFGPPSNGGDGLLSQLSQPLIRADAPRIATKASRAVPVTFVLASHARRVEGRPALGSVAGTSVRSAGLVN